MSRWSISSLTWNSASISGRGSQGWARTRIFQTALRVDLSKNSTSWARSASCFHRKSWLSSWQTSSRNTWSTMPTLDDGMDTVDIMDHDYCFQLFSFLLICVHPWQRFQIWPDDNVWFEQYWRLSQRRWKEECGCGHVSCRSFSLILLMFHVPWNFLSIKVDKWNTFQKMGLLQRNWKRICSKQPWTSQGNTERILQENLKLLYLWLWN